jgi:hypothetical protein
MNVTVNVTRAELAKFDLVRRAAFSIGARKDTEILPVLEFREGWGRKKLRGDTKGPERLVRP